MADDELIGTDNPLTDAQRRTLDIVLDLIVPASDDGRFTSAADIDVLGYVRENESRYLPTLREELDRLDEESQGRFSDPFAALAHTSQQALIDEIRAAEPSFMRGLALQTVTCYYQDDRVMQALGMEARPPYPKGFEVLSGDLSLLDPVRERGRIYREASKA